MKGIRYSPEATVALLTWLVALTAAWLAVANQAWAQTLLLAAVGGLYLFFPPSARFPRPLFLLAGLVLLLACTAFLPASWFGASYLKSFQTNGIVLPWTLSPQPWLTLEDLTLLLTTFLWAWYCFGANLSFEQRDFLTTCYLTVMGFVALNIILAGTSFAEQLPAFVRGAGLFENRNQTGDLLVMGGILSLVRGLGKILKQREESVWWLILSLVFLTAIFRNGSRAAVGLFGIGLLVAYSLMPKEKRRPKLILSALGVLIGIGIVIFIQEGADLRRRFLFLIAGGEGRLPIYRDALSMITKIPWNGIGLGNFEGVFNTERTQGGESVMRCLHPESDWLWVAIELGVVGAILFALMIIFTFRIYLFRRTPFPALTWASITVAVIFLLHGIIDVGGHRLGTVWNCLYLVSMGAYRSPAARDIKLPRFTLRLAGLSVLVLVALRLQSASVEPWMPTRASIQQIEQALQENHSPSDQRLLLNRCLGWVPLDWLFYYQRAIFLMGNPDAHDSSDADFNRALFLEQNSIDLPFTIGDVCQDSDRPEAMVAWQEALRRGSRRRAELFQDRFSSLTLSELMTLANHDPNLEAIAVSRQGHPDFEPALENLLAGNPFLEGVSPAIKEKLFDRWLTAGDTDELLRQWPLHPDWEVPGWRAYVQALAQAGRYPEAVFVALHQLPAPLRSEISTSPTTLEDLNDLTKAPNQSAADFAYLRAQSLQADGQDEAAWQVLLPLLKEP